MIIKAIGIEAETEKSVLVFTNNNKTLWIPKSVILWKKYRQHKIEMNIKDWFYNKNIGEVYAFIPREEPLQELLDD